MFRWITLCALALSPGLFARGQIAYIEFFGCPEIDVDSIRHVLPFREGGQLSKNIKEQARGAVKHITGREATDVAPVCCIGEGDSVIYIGLPGACSRTFTLNPAPRGRASFSGKSAAIFRKMDQAEQAAVQHGMPGEDNQPPGYRLMKEPRARAAELALREYALRHEDEIIRILELSSQSDQRAQAADALGYSALSPRQVAALVQAVRDVNPDVRNNATRALLEILRAAPSAEAQLEPDTFIDMLQSKTWTDRNKATALLWSISQSRDPQLLARLKSQAGDALWEMARWRNSGSAYYARVILGRVAAISEDRINSLALGPLADFAAAIGR